MGVALMDERAVTAKELHDFRVCVDLLERKLGADCRMMVPVSGHPYYRIFNVMDLLRSMLSRVEERAKEEP